FIRTFPAVVIPQSGVILAALTCWGPPLAPENAASPASMIGSSRPSRTHRAAPAARVIAAVTAIALIALPVRAEHGPPIIRDAEIEQLLKEYTQPILRVAGLTRQNIQVVIINDRSFNAFVADGRRIFVNGGALLDAETPNQIIGVL